MRKAKKEDILDLLDIFYEKYDVSPSDIQPFIFKGLLDLPIYTDLVETSLIKTKLKDSPITLLLEQKHSSRGDLTLKVDYRSTFPVGFESTSAFTHNVSISKFKRVAKQLDLNLLNTVIFIIEKSESFKDLINELSDKITEDQMDTLYKQNKNSLFSIMLDVYKAEKTTNLNDLNRLKDSIAFHFRSFESENHLGHVPSVIVDQHVNFEEFKEKLSDLVAGNFDMFKYNHELLLGMAIVSETEQSLMNKPVINDFFDKLAQEFPEYFLSREDSLYEYTLDDNELREHKTSAKQYYKDFDLFSKKYFLNITADYSSAIDEMPHYNNNIEKNSVKFIGENLFFKEYFVCAEHKKSITGLNYYAISSFDFNKNLPIDIVKGVVDKCLQLSVDSGLIMDIQMSSINIETKEDPKFDVLNYIYEIIQNYPEAKIVNTRDQNKKIANASSSMLIGEGNVNNNLLNSIKDEQALTRNKIKQKI